MPERIPQSIARSVTFLAYLSDGVSPATGKTIAITISKNLASFGNLSGGATNATEIGNGWYYVALSTTDTGTLGPLIVHGTCVGCDNVDLRYFVTDPHNMGFDGILDATIAGDAYSLLGTKIPQTIEFSHVGTHYYIAIDVQSWLGVIPAALTATGKFIQAVVMRWLTDDAPGTPLALDANGNVKVIKNASDSSGVDFSTTEKSSITNAVPNVASIQSGLATPTNITAATGITVATNNDKTGYTVSTVSDKTGYSLSVSGILAIWNQLTNDVGIIANSFGKLLGQFRFTIANQVDANAVMEGGLTEQNIRDAMKLAPSAGTPAGGSIDSLIGAIPTDPLLASSPLLPSSVIASKADITSQMLMSQTVSNKLGSTVNYVNLVTYNASWSGLSISSSWLKMYLTVKSATTGYQPDSDSTLQVMVSNPVSISADGITCLLSGIPTNTQRGYGSLSVDQVNGVVSLNLSDKLDLSSVLNDSHSYDIKCLLSTGESILIVSNAKFVIGTTETNSIQ